MRIAGSSPSAVHKDVFVTIVFEVGKGDGMPFMQISRS